MRKGADYTPSRQVVLPVYDEAFFGCVACQRKLMCVVVVMISGMLLLAIGGLGLWEKRKFLARPLREEDKDKRAEEILENLVRNSSQDPFL